MISKKPVACFGGLLAGLFFFAAGGLIANEIPDFIELDQDLYKSNRKGPVPFEHGMHTEDYEVVCNKCHHIYKDGNNVWKEADPVQKCEACHDPSESKGDIKKLRLAFHKNCKGVPQGIEERGYIGRSPLQTM